MGNGFSGSPLTQVLIHACVHNCPENIDRDILLLLSDIPFDVKVAFHGRELRSAIELAIDLKRFDIAKMLVIAGAHPIDPCIATGTKSVGITQLLKEYYEFGTNHNITWLLHEHLLSQELSQFIQTVVSLDILNKSAVDKFASVGRHPAHAILTCGHEEMIRKFVEVHGSEILSVKDETGRSSLQIAAERGDMESVKILVHM